MRNDGTTSAGDAPIAPEPDPAADRERIAGYLRGAQPAVREIDEWIRREIAARYPVLLGEIEDVCQAVHAKLLRNFQAERFQGRSMLRTYVVGVANHTAVDRIRRIYRDRAVFAPNSDLDERVASDNPYRSLRRAEEGRLLFEALQRSPEACRELWRLALVEKLSYEAIAERLAIPPGTVKSRMWYCRRKMIDLLFRMRGARGLQ